MFSLLQASFSDNPLDIFGRQSKLPQRRMMPDGPRKSQPVMAAHSRRIVLKRAAAAALGLLAAACRREPAPAAQTQAAFSDGALRLALRHRNIGGTETFDLVRLRAETNWRRSPAQYTAEPAWGDYRVSVYDAGGATLRYRAGFDSSAELSARPTTAELSVRVPLLRDPVDIVIEKRRAGSLYREMWRAPIDSRSSDIDRSAPAIFSRLDTVLWNGPPHTKVDIAILGDGYLESERAKFVADAKRAAGYLFSVDPFNRHIGDFNVHAVFAASAQNGVTDPYLGLSRDTVFRCTYGAGPAERTLSASDENAVREAASAVPYDFALVLANSRRYGGSAYFGGPAVVAIDSAAARYLVLHEFAHVIGGLAEEYYIADDGRPTSSGNIEPWHPNVTTDAANAKWRTPLGEPLEQLDWNKTAYERYFRRYVQRYYRLRDSHASEAAVEEFLQEESERQAALLAKNAPLRKVGLFEGANGYARRMFRAEVDCIMFSLQTRYFCSACAAAIERMIGAHTR
jgi:hypothetical protein